MRVCINNSSTYEQIWVEIQHASLPTGQEFAIRLRVAVINDLITYHMRVIKVVTMA